MPWTSPLSLSHRLWRLLPRTARRRALAGFSARLAPHPDRDAPPARAGVVVAGEFSRSSGLGEGARVMYRALARLGVPAFSLDLTRSAAPSVPADLPAPGRDPAPAGAALVVHVNPPMLPWASLHQKRSWLRGRRVVGFWSWELERVPAAWRAAVPLVHEVWVPSRFTARAIEPLLPGRVRVVPHALALAPPVPAALDRAAFGLPDATIIVLVSFNLASSFARKNPLAAITAFHRAFAGRADRMLVLKVGNAALEPEDFARIRDALAPLPNARVLTQSLPPAENHALTMACDIVLSLHRSEGFGLVPAEAMLLGKPVVATGWSGNLDFMDARSAALIPYRLIPARDPRGVFEAPGALWAEPDVGAAAARLVALADDAEARADLGRRGREMARSRLGAAPLCAALGAIGALPAPEPGPAARTT